jgi:hypothetical protein
LSRRGLDTLEDLCGRLPRNRLIAAGDLRLPYDGLIATGGHLLALHGLLASRLRLPDDGLIATGGHLLALHGLLASRLRLPHDGLIATGGHLLALHRLLASRLRLPDDGLIATGGHLLALHRLLASLLRLPDDGLIATREHLLALLGRLASLRRHRLPLRGHDTLLVLDWPLARGLPLHRLLKHGLLLVLVHLWRRGRRRCGLRLLPWGWRRRRLLLRLLRLYLAVLRRGLLRLYLLADLRLLLLRCFRGRLLRRGLRARMLRVLTAFGRRVLGHDDRPRRRCGRDALGSQEPLRQRQCGHCRERQQGAFSRRLNSLMNLLRLCLQNFGQGPLLECCGVIYFSGARDGIARD